jgi:hypothetical protein
MFLWFAGLSFVGVWLFFQDGGLDYRLVMLGALLPDVVDAPFGGARVLHTLVFSVVLLVATMLGTRRRRRLRRRLLALPIGTFTHLVLDGMWARTHVFWWPLFGASFGSGGLPSFGRPLVVLVLEELAGVAALAWCWGRFRLGEPDRWRLFVHTGHLGRDVAAPGRGRSSDAE